MEGPLVSDTTELLSGAAPASEDPPIGQPAAASPRSSGRNGGDLSKLLVSDLQRLAQELGISGTGRMRKGDLVAAITERTGGVRSTPRQSATRAASAGADTVRPLNQDAMEADTSVRSAPAAAPAAAGSGDAPASARPSGVAEPDHTAVSDRAASSDRSGISAATQHAGLSAEQSADAGAEAQVQNGGQDGRRDRRRNGRRDDQGGNGRDQRRDNREGRDNREP